MDYSCVIVDLKDLGLQEKWGELTGEVEFALKPIVSSVEEVEKNIKENNVAALVVFADSFNKEVRTVLESFQQFVGPLNEFQMFVGEEPSPMFMADAFEFGIELFSMMENWASEVAAFSRNVSESLSFEESPEAKVILATKAASSGDKASLEAMRKDLEDVSEYSYAAAFAKGKILEAEGKTETAAEAFRTSRSLNKKYRPSTEGLGNTLMSLGKVDEAIGLFESMEKTNPTNSDRKLVLANAYIENGDTEKAQACLDNVKKLDPANPGINEANTSLSLKSGNLEDAFSMMDQMSDVGPKFAAKLNAAAVDLAKKGKSVEALKLYGKAHKIVLVELKYKISLNAALACYRMGEHEKALKYIARVVKERGKTFPKLEKIKAAVNAAIKKKSAK